MLLLIYKHTKCNRKYLGSQVRLQGICFKISYHQFQKTTDPILLMGTAYNPYNLNTVLLKLEPTGTQLTDAIKIVNNKFRI
jgi:hypothetical protein